MGLYARPYKKDGGCKMQTDYFSQYAERLSQCGINMGGSSMARYLFAKYQHDPERIEQAVQALEHRIVHTPHWNPENLLTMALDYAWKPPVKVLQIPTIRFKR
jgi:hypothetical protein